MEKFDSDYATVDYIKKDNIVFLVWKREAHYDNYREPATFALMLLKKYEHSNFLFDARNGFEDVESDVEWGMSFLLPEMKKAGCMQVGFILNEVNDIEDEMDMWTKAFKQYFQVHRDISYEKVLKKMLQ
ncbi:hypothetical protein lbkm_2246 [Lachnospiraceae bacterium KM106-2]|nr:hypothetical protein lbkm_2246 [Lachnospiraceae bacterium KM106-2]